MPQTRPIGKFGTGGKTATAVPFSAATVTETAILRSQLTDLMTLVSQQGDVLAAHQEEIKNLRRQVEALRDGARLAEEP